MNEKSFGWDNLRLFLSVARNGGLSPASRETGRSAATLGRRMRALERYLGQELFLRHARGYALTSEGARLSDQLSDIETHLNKIASPRPLTARRLVKVSAGTWTTLALLGQVKDIVGQPADVRLRFVSTENVLDIMHREVIIGFRNHRPTEDGLAGRRLSRVEFAAFKRPDAPDKWIWVVAATPSAKWLDRIVADRVICEINTPRNGLDLALAGIGKMLMPTFIGDRQDSLQRCSDTIPDLAHDQWLVTHQDDRQQPEVRRVIDRLYAVFQPHP